MPGPMHFRPLGDSGGQSVPGHSMGGSIAPPVPEEGHMVATDCSLPIQVAIIAADPVLRAELRVRLHPEHDLAVVAEAGDVPGGRVLVDRLGSAVLLIDGDLPD